MCYEEIDTTQQFFLLAGFIGFFILPLSLIAYLMWRQLQPCIKLLSIRITIFSVFADPTILVVDVDVFLLLLTVINHHKMNE